jgi:hypothetical protein
MKPTTAIECKLIRAGGSRIPLGNTEYHFQPYTDGAHVCEVADQDHADRFLSITEGFRLYRGEGQPVNSAAPVAVVTKEYTDGVKATGPAPLPEASPAAAPEILLGGDYPATFDIGGTSYQLGTIVARAHEASGLTADDWNKQPQEARDAAIEQVLDSLAAAVATPPATTEQPQVDERAALAAEYERLYDKKPHHNTGIEKLRELIAAKQ